MIVPGYQWLMLIDGLAMDLVTSNLPILDIYIYYFLSGAQTPFFDATILATRKHELIYSNPATQIKR